MCNNSPLLIVYTFLRVSTMKFKDRSGEELIKKIQAQHSQVFGHRMWGTVFYEIRPRQDKEMDLKKSYIPIDIKAGRFTDYHLQLNNQIQLKNLMRNKLNKNGFYGKHYLNTEAAFKLHISINGIAELDESVMHGLMTLLIQESESPDNNMSFLFKFIDPQNQHHERFFNTDQLTLYFDKYSSAADLLRLSTKIEDYLLTHGVPKNKMKRGPKDSFGFNSFVSARFDTNRLLAQYDVYKFFDLELEKFFKTHPIDTLEIPLCAFEAVFNSVLFSDQVTNIHAQGSGLNNKESLFVQAEFERMLADPKAYLKNTAIKAGAELEKILDQPKFRVQSLINTVQNVEFDFSACKTNEQINQLLLIEEQKLHQLTAVSIKVKNDFANFDPLLFTNFKLIEQNKHQELNQLAQAQRASLMKMHSVQFLEQMKKFDKKINQLYEEGYPEKATIAEELHTTLKEEFNLFQASTKSEADYSRFKTQCTKAIEDAKPHLKDHRGWKELFFNLAIGIATLGTAFLINYAYTKGNDFFFKLNTNSVNQLNDINSTIDEMDIRNSH